MDGNIENLRKFTEYSNKNGTEVGLWTQQDLYPKDPNNEKPDDRHIDKEVGTAGVRGVKTDVAWVGPGYSFGLNGVRKAAESIETYSDDRRFVVSLDGWAGTQRYAGLWSGDQTGGNWEYIRLHIPTYIGSGLSGNPNIGSDIDGIFGGNNVVSTRDYQWKTFTPIIMDMDGWGSNRKNPFVFGEPYSSINRMYLKMKAEMMPYTYSIGREANETAMPMVRAMVLEYPEDIVAKGIRTQYQYMYGPNLLVAPIYNKKDNDANIRSNIYLPDENQVWIDYFTGKQYQGGQMLAQLDAPLWKAPLLVKNGAIIPMTVENDTPMHNVANADVKSFQGDEPRIFEVWPSGNSSFDLYEDDGRTKEFKTNDAYAKTHITSVAPMTATGTAIIAVEPTVVGGANSYQDATENQVSRGTEFVVNVRSMPSAVTIKTGAQGSTATQAAAEVHSMEDFKAATGNTYYYEEAPNLNKYATAGSEFASTEIITTPKLHVKVAAADVTATAIEVILEDFNNTQPAGDGTTAPPSVPEGLSGTATYNSMTLSWTAAAGSNVTYDIRVNEETGTNGYVIKGIKGTTYFHDDLPMDTPFRYEIRAVNGATGAASAWSSLYTTKTELDPYRNAVTNLGISAVPKDAEGNPVPDNSGEEKYQAVDGSNSTIWHSDWYTEIVFPVEIIIDMENAYQLDMFEYVPRQPSGGNGQITAGKIAVGLDGKHWKEIEDTVWPTGGANKFFQLNGQRGRYIKITVTAAKGNFLSAAEFRPYMLENTYGQPVGDTLASVGVLDELDFNEHKKLYAGIDKDSTLWGQVDFCDLNYNQILDSYDIAYVAKQIDGAVLPSEEKVNGQITLEFLNEAVKQGDEFAVKVVGTKLNDLYAFNVAIPFNSSDLVVGEDSDVFKSTEATAEMENLSKKLPAGVDATRLSVLFTSVGKPIGNGVGITSQDKVELATINLKANRAMTVAQLKAALAPSYGILVGTDMTSKDALTVPDTNTEEKPKVPYVPKRVYISDAQVWDKELNAFKTLPAAASFQYATDKDDTSFWETSYSGEYGSKYPVHLMIDMRGEYELDHFEYVPRGSANGSIVETYISHSKDGTTWEKSPLIEWWKDGNDVGKGTQSYTFPTGIKARYLRIEVQKTGGNGGNVAGFELKPFVKPQIDPTPNPNPGGSSGSSNTDPAATPAPTRNPDAPITIDTKGDWKEVIKDIGSAKPGTTISVEVKTETGVSVDLLKNLAGKDVNLNIKVNDLFAWNINGKNVTGLEGQKEDIKLGVEKISSKNLTTAVSRQLAGGKNEFIQFEIEHNGSLPFKGELQFLAGKDKIGKQLYLSYYNEAKKFMEYRGSSKVDKNGLAVFTLDHASQYVVTTVKPAPVGVATAVTTYRGKKYTMKPANLAAGSKVSFESLDKKFATVSKTGVVNPLKSGKVQVKTIVNQGGKKYTYITNITIKAPSITLTNKVSTIKAGKSADFYVKLNGFSGDIIWKSSDQSVATVQNGKVKALKPGTVTITVASGKITAKQTVKIVK